MYILYMAQNLMDGEEFFDLIIKGLSNMLLPLLLMVLAWSFAAVNDEIGFTKFITGTNWSMYIIALPIVLPVAEKTGDTVILIIF